MWRPSPREEQCRVQEADRVCGAPLLGEGACMRAQSTQCCRRVGCWVSRGAEPSPRSTPRDWDPVPGEAPWGAGMRRSAGPAPVTELGGRFPEAPAASHPGSRPGGSRRHARPVPDWPPGTEHSYRAGARRHWCQVEPTRHCPLPWQEDHTREHLITTGRARAAQATPTPVPCA